MLQNYCRAIEENQHLSEELKHCDEVARENFDLIARLEDELREKNNGSNPAVDCQNDIALLQAQLAERDQMIQELLNKMNSSNIQEASSNDVSAPMNLLDSADPLKKLRQTIKDSEAISSEIEAILNEKDNQLGEQQEKIDELAKQLEQSQKPKDSEMHCLVKLKEWEEHNEILANQALLLKEQFEGLLDEHNKLMENNNELIKSVIVCQKEICKYNFE